MLKEISINNTIEINKEIFDSIEIGEKFYIITTNRSSKGLYKYLCIKIEHDDKRMSFIHKHTFISCYHISCYMCKQFKCLGGKHIKIE